MTHIVGRVSAVTTLLTVLCHATANAAPPGVGQVLGTGTLSAAPLAFQGAINPAFYTKAARSCVLTFFRQNFANISTADNFPVVVRLAFHDAMAGGANGSLMKHKKEQTQQPTLDGYDVIRTLKNMTETTCGVPLSYADTLVLASAAGTNASGGNDFLDKLQLGRVDTHEADSPSLVPSSYWTTVPGYERWRQVGFSVKDFVAISGAHTIGCAHCTTIIARLTVLNSTWLNAAFRQYLKKQCEAVLNGSVSLEPAPVAGGGPNVGPQIDLDQTTPDVWDNGYYKNLLKGEGVLISDQALLSDSTIPETKFWVQLFADDNDAFLEAYEEAFVKMSLVGLKVEHLPAGQYPAVPSEAGCFYISLPSTSTAPPPCQVPTTSAAISSHNLMTADLVKAAL